MGPISDIMSSRRWMGSGLGPVGGKGFLTGPSGLPYTGFSSSEGLAWNLAPEALGITSVRTASQRLAVTASIISRGSIRPDECAVGGRSTSGTPHGVPCKRSQMETGRESGTGPVRLVRSTDNSRQEKSVKGGEVRNTGTGGQTPTLVPKRCPRFCVTSGTQCGLC